MLNDFESDNSDFRIAQRHPVTHWEAEIHGSPDLARSRQISPDLARMLRTSSWSARPWACAGAASRLSRHPAEVDGSGRETAWHYSQKIDDMLKHFQDLPEFFKLMFFSINEDYLMEHGAYCGQHKGLDVLVLLVFHSEMSCCWISGRLRIRRASTTSIKSSMLLMVSWLLVGNSVFIQRHWAQKCSEHGNFSLNVFAILCLQVVTWAWKLTLKRWVWCSALAACRECAQKCAEHATNIMEKSSTGTN